MSHSQPVPGHFNDDNILDLFIQSSANGIMQVKQNPHSGQKVKQTNKKIELLPRTHLSQAQVVDGASGRLLWEAKFVCPRVRLEATAVSTSVGQSVFLFWASEPIRAQKGITKATVSPPQRTGRSCTNGGANVHPNDHQVRPGVAAAEPLIRKLFLLYPAYPTILLELLNTTDTVVSSAGRFRCRVFPVTWEGNLL